MNIENVKSILSMDKLIIRKSSFERNEEEITSNVLDISVSQNVIHNEQSFRVELLFKITNQLNEFNIDVNILGDFHFEAEVDPKMKDILINQNTVAIMFPYVRSVVTLITSQPEMNPIVLPVININRLIELSKAKATNAKDKKQ